MLLSVYEAEIRMNPPAFEKILYASSIITHHLKYRWRRRRKKNKNKKNGRWAFLLLHCGSSLMYI